jgi:WD40 repeat protein
VQTYESAASRAYVVLPVSTSHVCVGYEDGNISLLKETGVVGNHSVVHRAMIKSLCLVNGRLWSTDVSGILAIWDLSKLPELPQVRQTLQLPLSILCVCIVGESVWFGGKGTILMVPQADPSDPEGRRQVEAHQGGTVDDMTATAYENVWSVGGDGFLHLWNLQGQLQKKITAHDCGKIFCVRSFGQYVFTGGFDCHIAVWNAEQGCLITTFRAHNDSVRCLLPISSHGLIFSGSRDRTIALWGISEEYVIENPIQTVKERAFRLGTHRKMSLPAIATPGTSSE